MKWGVTMGNTLTVTKEIISEFPDLLKYISKTVELNSTISNIKISIPEFVPNHNIMEELEIFNKIHLNLKMK